MSIVLFSPGVTENIQYEVERFPHVECAGLLLGDVENEGSTIRVLKSSGSGPKAKHNCASISPDIGFLNREIMEAEMSGLKFLGEWHNHPGSLKVPSFGDIATITEIMSDANLEQYLAAIVTREQDGIEINTYLFTKDSSCKNIPCASILTGLKDQKTSRTKQRIDMRDKQEERTQKRSEEGKEEQTRGSRSILSWFSRLFSKPNTLSKEKPKASPRQRWFETAQGRRRLSLERRLMVTRFPNFALLRKAGVIFWKGAYKEHTIVLKYPPDYPHQPLDVIIEPAVGAIPKESISYYATLAAQIAFLRIENSFAEETFSGSKLETPMRQKTTFWYETPVGRDCLAREQRLLDYASLDFIKLSDGKLVFDVNLNDRVSLIIICPDDYPNDPPQVKAPSRATEVRLDVHSFNKKISKQWGKSFKSIYSIVREIMRSNELRL